MKQKRQSTAFTLTLFCAFLALLLTACGGSQTQSARLKYDTNNVEQQNTPGATSTSGMTGTPGTGGRTEFVGEIPEINAWIGIMANGKNILAFTTDGSQDQPPTFAQWYMGTATNNNVQATPFAQGGTPTAQGTATGTATATVQSTATVQATATGAGGQAQGLLTAQLSQNAAMGKVTLSNGKTYPFTANAITDPNSLAGLYSSTETFNNVKYQAGWIIPPNAVPSATATPGTSSTGTPSTSSTTTSGETGMPEETATPTPSVSATSTATTGPNPRGASAIINQQTGEVLAAPMPTAQDLAAKQINVPNLGTFHLTH